MALQSMRARRLILPWDDAGIEAGETEYLKIPDDVSPVLAWLAGQGPDKTHLLQVDSNGNLLVSVSSLTGTQNVNLTQLLGTAIGAANPIPVAVQSGASAQGITKSIEGAVRTPSGLATVIIAARNKDTLLHGFAAKLNLDHGSPGFDYYSDIRFWIQGTTSGNTLALGYLTSQTAQSSAFCHVMYPNPIKFNDIFPTNEQYEGFAQQDQANSYTYLMLLTS